MFDRTETPIQFPFEVFEEEISQSFLELAKARSIPADYLGTTALFTIAALSGNMYQTELNGAIKNIIYAMLIGPSGLGKSPAFDILCGDIVQPLEQDLFNDYNASTKQWEAKRNEAKNAKPPMPFSETKPHRVVRTAKGGTMEGIMNHCMTSPAGFGLYYDEGGKMLGTPNQYKKDVSSVDFWNESWNGKYFNELRVDSDRERFSANTCISALIGMQSDRVKNYFTQDAISSGLAFRFLITKSDYIPLNPNVNHFAPQQSLSGRWRLIIEALFRLGCQFSTIAPPRNIKFTQAAKNAYNELSYRLILESNSYRIIRKSDDVSELMIAYDSKLYAYVGRFIMILAIIDNYNNPLITETIVTNAEKLYRYYRDQAQSLFKPLNEENLTGLSEKEQLLLDSLPSDSKFEKEVIIGVCKALRVSEKFFDTTFRRKYKFGYIRKVGRATYTKDL